jgi:hypothetical protein
MPLILNLNAWSALIPDNRSWFQAALSRPPPVATGAMPCRKKSLPKIIIPAAG